jgi:hypothetical protein
MKSKLSHVYAVVGMYLLSIFVLLLVSPSTAKSQMYLSKRISLNVTRQPVGEVLEILSNKGDFYFSYNTNIISRDTLITLSESNKSIREILEIIFKTGFEFKESGNYIIIRRAPIKLTLVTTRAATENKVYMVTGYIVDDQTGERVSYASIYEKDRLASAITNENGFFRLKLKSKYRTASLTVSKEFYEDTTVVIEPRFNQQVTITIVPVEITEQSVIISPKNYQAPDSIVLSVQHNDSTRWLYTYRKTDSQQVETTRLGLWLLSPKLKFQTINLRKFFTVRPYQVSVVPGLSTNGAMNSQVINTFSFNLFGGYSGGVNGFELGGLFNINKKSVRYVQVGGIFNTVGGDMQGLQVAGIHNSALGEANGLQIAGINNYVGRNFTGLQVAGIYNHAGGRLSGMQIGGIANYTNHAVKGIQLAGIANMNTRETKGMQIGGILNYTKKLSGMQIGLINISEESDGYSIGLINIVLKGYHKLVFSTNDVMTANIAFKTGNRKFYSILLAGMNTDDKKKIYSYGYGLGSERYIGRWFSISPEITSQYLHLGSWDHLNLLNKANLNFNIRFGKHLSIFGGPSFNVYYTNQTLPVADYKFDIPSSKVYRYNDYVTGWIGWNAGISIF